MAGRTTAWHAGFGKCDACGARASDLHHHGEDFDLCPKCSDSWMASVLACSHQWDREPAWSEWGDVGQVCRLCGVFVDQQSAVWRYPLVCDGYVEVPAHG